MNWAATIGSLIVLFIVIGFVSYLVRLNRRAKHQQSRVDPTKLRTWSDD